MENVSANSNGKGIRDKVLKKAAMLATVASITGACAVGAQQPKESKALIGAIIGVLTTVIGVGSSIASTVQSGVAQSEYDKQAKLQAEAEERARKEAEEQERIKAALETSENNVRVAQQISAQAKSETVKEIDVSIANNDELMAQSASRVSMHTTGVNRVTAPKDINVGGFGSSDEVQESEEIVESVNVEESTSVEGEILEDKDSQEQDFEVSENVSSETLNNSLVNLTNTNSDSNSNIVRFSLSDLSADESFNSSDISGVVQEEVMVHGVGLVDGYNSTAESEEYIEIDESMLMSVEEAEEHSLVREGFLTAEDLIILDFGIRNGAINQEIIDAMYENGDISDEYYEGAIELMNEIYEEFSQE